MVLLYLLFKVALLAAFMTCLTQLKYSVKKSYGIIVIFNTAIWLANYAIYVYKGTEFLDKIFPLTASLPAFICFSFVSKSKGSKVLFSLLTVSIFGMLTSFIASFSSLILNSFALNIFLQILCFALIIVFIVKVFRKPYFKIQEALDKGWGLFCAVPVLLIAIIYVLQYFSASNANRPEDTALIFLTYTLMFIFYAIVFLNFENIFQYYQLKQDKQVMLLQTDMQKKEYAAIVDKINAIRIYRHDMRHHIDAINTLLNDNNVSEAQKYLSKLNENPSRTVVEKYCENYSVNVILSSYIKRANDQQIAVASEVTISENIKIDTADLGVIFANAIENAIIACGKIENPSDRKITIDCIEHYGQLYIQIGNTFMGEVLFDGEYPVSNNADHGIGTRSIAAIAEKYGGIFSFTAEDGIFKSTVILNYL